MASQTAGGLGSYADWLASMMSGGLVSGDQLDSVMGPNGMLGGEYPQPPAGGDANVIEGWGTPAGVQEGWGSGSGGSPGAPSGVTQPPLGGVNQYGPGATDVPLPPGGGSLPGQSNPATTPDYMRPAPQPQPQGGGAPAGGITFAPPGGATGGVAASGSGGGWSGSSPDNPILDAGGNLGGGNAAAMGSLQQQINQGLATNGGRPPGTGGNGGPGGSTPNAGGSLGLYGSSFGGPTTGSYYGASNPNGMGPSQTYDPAGGMGYGGAIPLSGGGGGGGMGGGYGGFGGFGGGGGLGGYPGFGGGFGGAGGGSAASNAQRGLPPGYGMDASAGAAAGTAYSKGLPSSGAATSASGAAGASGGGFPTPPDPSAIPFNAFGGNPASGTAPAGGAASGPAAGGGLLGNLSQSYQDALNSSNKANATQLQSVLNGYGGLQNNLLGVLNNVTNQQWQDLANTQAQNQSAAQQNLTDRGLGNTTVGSSINRGIAQDYQQAKNRLTDDRLGQVSNILQTEGSGALNTMAGFNQQGPDFGTLAGLAQGIGQSGQNPGVAGAPGSTGAPSTAGAATSSGFQPPDLSGAYGAMGNLFGSTPAPSNMSNFLTGSAPGTSPSSGSAPSSTIPGYSYSSGPGIYGASGSFGVPGASQPASTQGAGTGGGMGVMTPDRRLGGGVINRYADQLAALPAGATQVPVTATGQGAQAPPASGASGNGGRQYVNFSGSSPGGAVNSYGPSLLGNYGPATGGAQASAGSGGQASAPFNMTGFVQGPGGGLTPQTSGQIAAQTGGNGGGTDPVLTANGTGGYDVPNPQAMEGRYIDQGMGGGGYWSTDVNPATGQPYWQQWGWGSQNG